VRGKLVNSQLQKHSELRAVLPQKLWTVWVNEISPCTTCFNNVIQSSSQLLDSLFWITNTFFDLFEY